MALDPDVADLVRQGFHDRMAVDLQHLGDRRVEATLIRELLVAAPANGVAGRLDLTGAAVEGRLDLEGLTLGSMVRFAECTFDEGISLLGATAGLLRFEKSRIAGLSAAGLQAASIDLRNSHVHGMGLQGARLGSLTLLHSEIVARPGMDFALMGDQLVVEGHVSMTGTEFKGGLGLHGARFAGTFALENSVINRAENSVKALQAHGIQIGGALIGHRLQINGTVAMQGAEVRGDVDFSYASLTVATGTALDMSNAKVAGDIRMAGTAVDGPVVMVGTRIDGTLNAEAASLNAPTGVALTLDRAAIGNCLMLRHRFISAGLIKMSSARIEVLSIDLKAWPATSRVNVDGLVVGAMENAGRSSEAHRGKRSRYPALYDWIEWADRHCDGFTPTFFEQLAVIRQRNGDEGAARTARYEAEVRRSALPGRMLPRIWNFILRVTVGFGHIPERAAVWLALLLASGTVFYRFHELVPAVADENLHWDPFLYTLDVLVPIVDLGYDKAFQTSGIAKAVMVILMLSGWALVAAFVAAAGRLLTRR